MRIIPTQKDQIMLVKLELNQIDRSLLLRKGISKEEKLPKVLSISEEVMGHSSKI